MQQRGAWVVVVAAGIVVTLSAQGPAPAFAVASVKRAEPGIQGGRVQFLPGGRFSGENVPIDFVVQYSQRSAWMSTDLSGHGETTQSCSRSHQLSRALHRSPGTTGTAPRIAAGSD